MTRSISVCHVVNTFSDASFEVHFCNALSRHTAVDPVLVSLFDDASLNETPDFSIHELDHSKSLLYRIGELKELFRECDLVHSHHNRSGAIAKVLASALGIPNIKTEHNNHAGFHPAGRFINGLTNPLADEIVCVSESVRESMNSWEKTILRTRDLSVIYNGVTEKVLQNRYTSDFDLYSSLEIPEGSTIISTVGMHEEQKGYDTLVRAMSSVVEQTDREVTLVLTGDGSERKQLETLTSELNLDGSIFFTGYLPTKDDVYAVLDETDIYVMPSRWEGHSIAALEAMAYEIPCVFSKIPSFEIPFDDVALFHDVDDPTDLSRAIMELVKNPSLQSNLGNEGRQKVVNEFTMRGTAENYEEVYFDQFGYNPVNDVDDEVVTKAE